MIEDSPESFIARWREHAATVELFPHTEGSPLLEARAGQALMQLFERTGPYLARPGRAKVIIHPVTQTVERITGAGDGQSALEPGIEVTGVSRFEVRGRIEAVDGRMLVVDAAGVPLVVAVLQQEGAPLRPGELVRFSNRPPAHGFVLAEDRRSVARGREEHHDDTI